MKHSIGIWIFVGISTPYFIAFLSMSKKWCFLLRFWFGRSCCGRRAIKEGVEKVRTASSLKVFCIALLKSKTENRWINHLCSEKLKASKYSSFFSLPNAWGNILRIHHFVFSFYKKMQDSSFLNNNLFLLNQLFLNNHVFICD